MPGAGRGRGHDRRTRESAEMTTPPAPTISPFSGQEATVVWGRRDGMRIFQCPATDALFFDRHDLRREDYQDYYPYLKDWAPERFAYELKIRREKYRTQLAVMRRYAPGNRMLDVGAGPGYFCKVARDEGWSARGLEVAAEAVVVAQLRRDVARQQQRLLQLAGGGLVVAADRGGDLLGDAPHGEQPPPAFAWSSPNSAASAPSTIGSLRAFCDSVP